MTSFSAPARRVALRLLLVLLGLVLPAAGLHAQVLPRTVSGGFYHSLAIHADGTLWATGDNGYGQLGIPTTTARSTTWVQVGTATDWVQVAAGQFHSLGLRADGTLYAWGYNKEGELGNATNNGTTTANPTPTVVAGTYTQVAAGAYHSLGLRANGALYAWGDNRFGQLGNPTNSSTLTPTPTPTQVAGTYTQMAAGSFYSLGLRADGSLYAWGYNQYGQLGNGTTLNAPNPALQQVAGTYTQVAAGDGYSLGLRADGSLWAWGNNFYGQLGNPTRSGTNTPTPSPTQVAGTYAQVSAGLYHALGLRADGSLYAWGRNQYGQLSNGTTSNGATSTPTQVAGTYAQVAAGAYHSLALQADGSLYAGGFNNAGQLGNGATANATPTATATGTALVTRSLAMGSNFGLAVRGDGTLWAWGDNAYGQLGLPTTTASTARPVPVGTATDWVMVAAGQSHSLALRADGTLYAWGLNQYGQLGNATNNGTGDANPTPTVVAGTYTQVAAGYAHSLGLRADGTLYAWGQNRYGQLGSTPNSGNFAANPTPTVVDGTYTQVAAGSYHSLGLRADGTLYAWGFNSYGQLGSPPNSGTTTATPTPTQVAGAYTQVAAGSAHSLGLTANGSLYAWGLNRYGQLGTATSSGTATANPEPLLAAGTYTQVAAGLYHSLGLQADGSLYAWGYNSEGQLGNGSTSTAAAATPTREATAGTSWTTLGTGATAYHSLVRTPSAQNFASAGQNSSGQLGDYTTTQATRFDRLSPLTSLQALPVQLVQFTATASGPRAVRLAWATASEHNSQAFEVERSMDGRSFAPLGTVPAAGTSSSTRHYELLDTTPPTHQFTMYYRLRQVDRDGTASYSPVRAVGLHGAAAGLALFPNPAHGAATLTGAQPGAVVTVTDALGHPVLSATADAAGTAALALPAGLPAGVYIIRSGAQARRLTVE